MNKLRKRKRSVTKMKTIYISCVTKMWGTDSF